jgi:hypothetical protein
MGAGFYKLPTDKCDGGEAAYVNKEDAAPFIHMKRLYPHCLSKDGKIGYVSGWDFSTMTTVVLLVILAIMIVYSMTRHRSASGNF